MAFKPNYNLQRADRNRAARARPRKNSASVRKSLRNAKRSAHRRRKVNLRMRRHNGQR